MKENKPKRSDIEIAEEFDRLFDEIPEPKTDEEVLDYLIEAGYDPETLKTQGAEFVKYIMASNWRFVPLEDINETVTKIDEIPFRKEWNRLQLTTAIQKLSDALASKGRQPSLAFRNLQELTEADLAIILQELEYKARTNGIDLDLG